MTDRAPAKILQHLIGLSDAMRQSIEEIAAMESPSSDPASQQPLFAWFESRLRDLGWRCCRFPGERSGGQLFATPENAAPSDPKQLLLGHCDTVWPTGTLSKMPVHVQGNRLHGPGVFDMKGGWVQALFAIQTLNELGIDSPVTPVIFINSDEEIGSGESRSRISHLARCVDRVLVMEPALGEHGKIKTRRKGVGRYRIEIRGRAAHAGLDPEKGISAIAALAPIIEQLCRWNDPASGTSVNVGVIGGGTQPNVIAAESYAEVDIRVHTAAEAEKVDRQIRSLRSELPGASIVIHGGISRPPLEQTAGNLRFWETAVQVADSLNLSIEQATAGGGSDGNFTSLHAPTLDGLGAVGSGAHALDEHLILPRMPERAALLACLLLQPPFADRNQLAEQSVQFAESEFDLNSCP